VILISSLRDEGLATVSLLPYQLAFGELVLERHRLMNSLVGGYISCLNCILSIECFTKFG